MIDRYDGNMLVAGFTWVFKDSGKTLALRECVECHISRYGSEVYRYTSK